MIEGLTMVYAAVQAPMIAGLVHARAQLRHYLISPFVAAPLTVAAAVGIAMSSSWFGQFGYGHHSFVQLAFGAGLSAALGYGGGVGLARSAPDDASHQRGSIVADLPPP